MSSSEWKECLLKDICIDGKGSYGIGASAVEYSENLYTYLRITDINDDGTLNKEGLKSVDDDDAEKYLLKPNDIVFARTGNSTGRSYFYDGNDGTFVYAGFLIKFSLDEKKVNPRYFKYYTLSDEYKSWVNSFSTGSTRGNINAKTYGDMKIYLPPREQQDFLVNILSSLDEKIELNNQMNKTLEEIAQALFKRWFVDFEFPNEEGEPYKSSGGEMVDSELGMIPKGWKVCMLGDLCELSTKSEKPFDNKEVEYEHFSIPAYDEKRLPIIEKGSDISSNKYKIDNECILISKLNPSTKRIWNPLCNTANAICSTEFMVYRPLQPKNKSFCYEVINADKFTEFLLANVTGSTGSRQRTQPKKTLEYKIAIQDEEIINRFSEIIKPMHDLINNNLQNNNRLMQLRDTLLPKLMSGEIRVKDLQN